MSLGRIDYPHPILQENDFDFLDCNFEVTEKNIEGGEEIKSIKMVFSYELKCKTFEDYLKQDIAEVVLYLECMHTNYRKLLRFESNSDQITFTVNKDEVYKELTIKPYIVAKVEIEKYSPEELNQDLFDGYSGVLRKGDILAISKITKIYFEEYDLSNSSIFKILKNSDLKGNEIEINCSNDNIEIYLSNQAHDDYNHLKGNDSYSLILSGLYVMPALIEVLSIMKSETSIDDYENCKWYKVIKSKLDKYNISLENESSLIVVANRILPDIFEKAVSSIKHIESQLDREEKE